MWHKQLHIILAVTLSAISGCRDVVAYNITPFQGVEVQVALKDYENNISNNPGHTFSYITYRIINNSKEPLALNVGQARFEVGGIESVGSYYDSVASVLARWVVLPQGTSTVKMYTVFPVRLEQDDVMNIKIISLGLEQGGKVK